MIREIKDSGIDWIGRVPVHWIITKAKYIFTERKEHGNKKTLQLLSPTQKYGVIPQSLYEELSGMKAVKLDEKTDFNSMRSIYNGDFCISLRSFQGGFEYSEYDGVVSPAYHVFYGSNTIFNPYYKYLFKEQGFISKMASLTKTFRDGKSISYADFADSLIPVPPLQEQISIAAFLDNQCSSIDNIIEKTKASIEEYKKLKQAIITQAITHGIRGNRKMKDTMNPLIGMVAENRVLTRVKYVANRVTDGAHVSPDYDDYGYDFISTVNLVNGEICFDGCLKTSKESYETFVKTGCQPHKNDVLISKDGSVGKTAIISYEREFVVGSSLVIITPIAEVILPEYLDYNLRCSFVQNTLLIIMHGTALKRVSVEKNANLPILLVDLEEQREIVEYLDIKCSEIDNLISRKERVISEMESYKKSTIYEYVTGKKEA